jgi:HK97 family phage portal protein
MNLRGKADAYDFGVRDWLGHVAAKGLPPGFGSGLPTPAGIVHNGVGGAGSGSWRILSPGSNFDYEAAAGDLWRNPAVMACLRVLADNFPEPRLEVARDLEDGTTEAIPDHDLVRLLARPNAYYDRFALWEATVLSLESDGNAYWFKVRNPNTMKVVEVWYIPHFMLEPLWPADGSQYISAWLYTVNGRRYVIHKDDVVHFRYGIDPRNDRKGLSRLKQACREIATDNAASTFTAALVKNSGVPSVIITPSEPGGQFFGDDADDIKDQWRQNYSGDNVGTPMVTSSVKVEKLSFSPKELALGDLPDRLEDRICGLSGVPAMLAGVTAGASHKTYANYAESRRGLYQDKIIPCQRRVAETLTLQLLEADFLAPAGSYVRFDYRGIQCLQEDLNAVAERVGSLYQKDQVITRKEARAALNYTTSPEDEVYFSEANPAPEPTAPPPSPAGDAEPPSTKALDGDAEREFLTKATHLLERFEREASDRPGRRRGLWGDP